MSPLGKYSAPAAAIGSLLIIGGYILAVFFAIPNIQDLKDLCLLAAGALFGSAVAVNGYKSPLAAVHKRLDLAGIPPAADGNE